MQIERLDPADDDAAERVVALWRAAQEADRPQDPAFCPGRSLGQIRHPMPGQRAEYWTATDGGDLLGVLDLAFPDRDNLTSCWFEVIVHPGARRRGVGAALYRQACSRSAELGRKLLIFETPEDGAPARFAASIGAEVGVRDARRRLVVDADSRAAADRLLADALPRAAGYPVLRWLDATPEPHLDGMAYLAARMSTDAPMENLDWQPEVYDAARIRDRDAVYAARGTRRYTSVVLHERTGALAGYSEVFVHPDDPTHGEQGDTIVEPAHRGHRLGMVLKAENLRFVLDNEPALGTIMTWNAASNAHMIAVNEAMGFRVWDHWNEWQVRL